jgi:hypothetical protein
MAYFYKGKRYNAKPVKTKFKSALKHLASRAWESIQGGHPGGAEALVEKMVEQYPPKQPAQEVRGTVGAGAGARAGQPTEPTQPDNSSEKD